jgi:hypothetical protein
MPDFISHEEEESEEIPFLAETMAETKTDTFWLTMKEWGLKGVLTKNVVYVSMCSSKQSTLFE